MPLYEYECDACSHRFEKIQKFSDPLEDTCPKCGGRVHKLMSSPAIAFKGSGFYITDYAKKEHTAAAKADSAQSDRADTSEKADKSEKTLKAEKSEKSEKAQRSEKSEKTDTSAKTEKSASSTDSSQSTSTSSTTSPASTPSTKN
jgi:putative FmdB family regulatory protein